MTLEALLDALDVVGDAPEGVERLRRLVLALAVRGLLVSQSAEDGAAELLLKSIDPAEDRRFKPKRTRPPKALKPLSRAEIPDWLPSGWAATRLGLVTQFQYGDGISKSERNDAGEVPVMGSNGVLGYHTEALVPGPVIVIGRKGSAGALTLHESDCWPSDVTYFVHAPSGIDIHFWLITLKTLDLPALSNGIKPGLNREMAHELPAAVPPVAEQRRIVAKVDELMDLLDAFEKARDERDARRTALRDSALSSLQNAENADAVHTAWTRIAANLDTLFTDPADIAPLRQTILQLAVRGRLMKQDPEDEPASEFEDASAFAKHCESSLPQHWVGSCLRKLLVDGLTNGWSPKASEIPTGLKTLRLSATTRGKFDRTQFKYVDASPSDVAQYLLKKNDLLIQRSNTAQYVGMAAIYNGGDDEFMFPDLMMRGTVEPTISARFVHIALCSPSSREYFASQASGTSSSMVKLSQTKVLSVPIPLPPLAEQTRLVAKVDELMAICDELEQRLTETRDTQAAFAAAAVHHLDVGRVAAEEQRLETV